MSTIGPVAGGTHPVERIWRHIAVDDNGCWVWGGALRQGYGTFGIGRVTFYTHRVSYEYHVGPIPDGMQMDHLCRVRACCNPEHLEPVTSRVNSLRGEGIAAKNAAKTHCDHGHPFSGDNLQTWEATGRRRYCRACGHDAMVARWARMTPEEKAQAALRLRRRAAAKREAQR